MQLGYIYLVVSNYFTDLQLTMPCTASVPSKKLQLLPNIPSPLYDDKPIKSNHLMTFFFKKYLIWFDFLILFCFHFAERRFQKWSYTWMACSPLFIASWNKSANKLNLQEINRNKFSSKIINLHVKLCLSRRYTFLWSLCNTIR